jgi:hypothetical protein
MKRFTFLLLLTTLSTLAATAQNDLKKTRWTGIANIPSPVEITFEFRQDSLLMLSNTNDILEVMHFSIKDDLLLITKISGMSPCGEEAASYRFSIKNDTLLLVPVTDACDERSSAFSGEGYRRKTS